MITGNEIREKFLSFFASKEHLVLPSASLIPENDPSLLLIGAGMAPFKAFFTGKMKPPSYRIATSQKCIRTGDIDNVGRTARHHTFFEMLGNFSFGNYFKKEAIAWAWEFVTSPQYLGIDPDKMWVTIHPSDDEAFEIWHKEVGLPIERIVRLEDNFWEIGQGPCGPCSEIFVDLGPARGCDSPDCGVGCDCDRYLEIWNLVFTQFNKEEDGSYTPLEKKNIDTGAGLERITSVLQNKSSNFETDLIFPIIEYAQSLATVKYGDSVKSDISLKVIADHARSMTVMIGDGVLPSNEGRGYVLRRILRRAIRHGKLIGIKQMFLVGAVDTVFKIFGNAYPELQEKGDYIKKVIQLEEERFNTTLEQGTELLNAEICKMTTNGCTVLDGQTAFKLYDTFGFPWELTVEILQEHDMSMDKDGFDTAMKEQRERARAARGEKDSFMAFDFTGIDTTLLSENECAKEATIQAIFDEQGKQVRQAFDGQDVAILLDVTPFYAEGGGQLGDVGTIKSTAGNAIVNNTVRLPDRSVIQRCTLVEGQLQVGDKVLATTEGVRKMSIARNHTATHLLHKALKKILGEHVNQAGSYVGPDRLRFDFSHFSQVSKEELERIEDLVNEQVLKGLDINKQILAIDEAKKMGATALFGEKYGEKVRVVTMGDYSMELCGGTHLDNTAQVGLFKIITESSVGAGVRRIEAVTGAGVLAYLKEQERLVQEIAATAKCRINDIVFRIECMHNENKELQSKNTQLTTLLAEGKTQNIEEQTQDIEGVKVLAVEVPSMGNDDLRNFGDKLRDKVQGLVVLASVQEDKINLLAMATKEAVGRGIHAGNIIKEVAQITGGRGGGRPDMAQAGGKDASKIAEALQAVSGIVATQVKK